MRPIIPVRNLTTRLPTQGRIRIGVKTNDNRRMKAIDTFRLTSPDKDAIHDAAERYGGTPRAWEDGPRRGEWEVVTETNVLPIALAADPLGGTPIYELWSAGGCQRRCDGEMCQVPRRTGPDDVEMVEVPCLCDKAQEMACKPKTRLTVILRELRFGGGWRYETGSWTAVHEMPGMVEAIANLQQRGLQRGLLALDDDSVVVAGKTKRFKIVRLRTDLSVEDIVSGFARVGSLGPSTAPALGPGAGETVPPQTPASGSDAPPEQQPLEDPAEDDGVIDVPYDGSELDDAPVSGGNQKRQVALVLKVKELCDWWQSQSGEALEDDDVRHDLADQQTKGRTSSSTQMTDEEKGKLMERIDKAMAGTLQFGIKAGKARIGRAS